MEVGRQGSSVASTSSCASLSMSLHFSAEDKTPGPAPTGCPEPPPMTSTQVATQPALHLRPHSKALGPGKCRCWDASHGGAGRAVSDLRPGGPTSPHSVPEPSSVPLQDPATFPGQRAPDTHPHRSLQGAWGPQSPHGHHQDSALRGLLTWELG